MATDMFIKIGSIPGESQDAQHRAEIDVLSWSWGESNTGPTHYGGGAGAGKVTMQDFTFTHHVDAASPQLMTACARGTHIPDVVFTARRGGGTPLEFLVIRLRDAVVASVSLGGAETDEAFVESVALDVARVTVEYRPQRPDGSLGTPVTFDGNGRANGPL